LGKAYQARAVYPFVEAMPWKLTAGQPISLTVPGDSVMVFEIQPGTPPASTLARPEPLPRFRAEIADTTFSIQLDIPDEYFPCYDLIVQTWGGTNIALEIDGRAVAPDQQQQATRWTVARYDLRSYRGRKLDVRGTKRMLPNPASTSTRRTGLEVWSVVNRQVESPDIADNETLPLAISQYHRRITQNVLPKTPF
jgi:hypothetical protein